MATDYLDDNGKVVGVTSELGYTYIVARGNHRAKSAALPPRDTEQECQRDLDRYAEKHGWRVSRLERTQL